jgi:nitroreductase
MDVSRAVATVRTVREFTDEPLDDAEIEQLIHAGRRAGSSKNLQRWGFVVVRDRSRLQELSAAGPWAGHIAGAAAAIALVVPDPRAPEAPLSIVFDIGRAAQNIVLTAWEMGIGSCPATVYEQVLVRGVLGYPDDHHCEYILSVGRPADPVRLTRPARAGGRLQLDDVLHHERW